MSKHQTARNLNILCGIFLLYLFTGAELQGLSAFGVALNISHPQPIMVGAWILFFWLCYRHSINAPISLYLRELKSWGRDIPGDLALDVGLTDNRSVRYLEIKSESVDDDSTTYECVMYSDSGNSTGSAVLQSTARRTLERYRAKWSFFTRSDFTADHAVPWFLAAVVIVVALVDLVVPVADAITQHIWSGTTVTPGLPQS